MFEIDSILAMLDGGEFPEAYNYLSSLDEEANDAYEIASTLINLDVPEEFPGFMIDFITELYETAVYCGNADAMNDLGAQYYGGHRGFEQSFEKAMMYYKMAAQHGNRRQKGAPPV